MLDLNFGQKRNNVFIISTILPMTKSNNKTKNSKRKTLTNFLKVDIPYNDTVSYVFPIPKLFISNCQTKASVYVDYSISGLAGIGNSAFSIFQIQSDLPPILDSFHIIYYHIKCNYNVVLKSQLLMFCIKLIIQVKFVICAKP